ncbi:retrovirus-related pol polyprotein from transposon TNT 1-94 [Tanacetum coccineum]
MFLLSNLRSSKLSSVKFGNDHVAKILGYGELLIGQVTITRVLLTKWKDLDTTYSPFGKFCDSNLRLAFVNTPFFIRNLEGKSKKKPHKPKSEDTNQEKLYLLHMDLCGPMRVASIIGKKTDNGTEFVNQTLREYYEKVGISHETSVARSSQQNGVVERRNHTLIEAARTMLIYAKAPLFLWAEAVATACYTQN